MDQTGAASVRKSKSFGRRLLDVWQVVVAIFVGLIVFGLLTSADKLNAPGAPTLLYRATIGAGVLVALAHLVPVFWQPTRPIIWTAYVGTLAFFVMWMMTMTELRTAWQKTPKGAAEARAHAEADRLSAQFEAERKQVEAEAQNQERSAQQAKDRQDKLESCFTTFGHRLPKLEEAVKSGLGNPDSFDQVKTQVMRPDADGYDVVMTFRARNQVGALWTYDIRAAVGPENCEISKVEPAP